MIIISCTTSLRQNLPKNWVTFLIIFCLAQPLTVWSQTQKVWHLQMEPFLDEAWANNLDEVDRMANEAFIDSYRDLVYQGLRIDYWVGSGQTLVKNPFDLPMLFDKKENAYFPLDSINKATYPIALRSWQVAAKEKDKIYLAGNHNFFDNGLVLKNNFIQLLPETKTIAGVVCKKASLVLNPLDDENIDLQITLWYNETIPAFGLYENIFADVFPGAVMEFIIEGGYGLKTTKAQQVTVPKNFLNFPYGFVILADKFDYYDYTRDRGQLQIKTPAYPSERPIPPPPMSAEKMKKDSIWTVFADEENELFGYKDIYGKIKIAPKFSGFVSAYRFDKIMGAMEIKNDKAEQYILLKNGKKITGYLPYVFDHTYDCESEGYLRITDSRTEKMGMMNAEGEVAVPLKFNFVTKMENGMYAALSNAKKGMHGDYAFWEGGQWNLFDKDNNLLIENIRDLEYLDFFSLHVTDAPSGRSDTRAYPGANGKYYNFTDTKMQFDSFLKTHFTSNTGIAKDMLFHTILVGRPGEKEDFPVAQLFIERHSNVFERLAQTMGEEDAFLNVQQEKFVRFINPDFNHYFVPYRDNCLDFTKSHHPLFSVSFKPKNTPAYKKERLYFLRINNGFKLIWAEINDN